MSGVKTFFDSLEMKPGKGVSKTRLGKLEKALNVELPDDFRELYGLADGFTLEDGMEVHDVEQIESYADMFAGPFGYVPFASCHDSNFYALCCNEPVRGLVAHLYHDDESKLICRGLGRFLDIVAERVLRMKAALGTDEVDEVGEANRLDFIAGDLALNVRQRSEQDVRAARELVRLAATIDPEDMAHNEALRYAAHLFGEGQEDELAGLFDDNEYVRGTALERLHHLGTPRARQVLAAHDADFTRFVDRMVDVLRGAGMQVRRQDNAVTVDPGNIHLNAEVFYNDRRKPDVFEEMVERVRGWQKKRR
jgi:hypothetical protein